MDSFGEIGVFVRVVEARSFTGAGKRLGLTASGVSRVISRLEARLGVRLLERTTRSIGLTTDGAVYYERCAAILRELEDAESMLARVRGAPRGRLRVDAPTILERFALAPALPRFLLAYPELAVDFSVRDHIIDPVAEGMDVVLRLAELRESELVQKKLGSMRLVVVASPRYLRQHGRPSDPRDLRRHQTIGFLAGGAPLAWRFRMAGHELTLPLTGRLHTNSADAICNAVVSDLGLAQLFEFHVRDEIARGALEVVLPEHELPSRPIYALYGRGKSSLPKVRAFLDFVEELLGAGVAERPQPVSTRGASVRRG